MKIHIADESEVVRKVLRVVCTTIPEAEVIAETDTPEKTLRTLRYSSSDVVILDPAMFGAQDKIILEDIRHLRPDIIPIVVTSEPGVMPLESRFIDGVYYFDKTSEILELRSTLSRLAHVFFEVSKMNESEFQNVDEAPHKTGGGVP